MESLNTVGLILIFALGGAITWIAGVSLARATDVLDGRWHLGDDLGGMLLLAVSGTLPEIAITVSAAAQGHLDIAAGNLIGGIAVQTMVIAICDIAVPGDKPLSYLVGSLVPMLEASLVIAVTTLVLMGALLPPSVSLGGVSYASIGVVVFWLFGLAVLNRVRRQPGWQLLMPGSSPGRAHRRMAHPHPPHRYATLSTGKVAGIFAAGSLVTLIAGVALQETGNELANRGGINGVLFGATILALVTALPEISTGITAVRLGDNRLAMSDIFGGNAFQVCLFPVADLIAGRPVLPAAGPVNSWLAALGIVLSVVYGASVIVRPSARYFRLGADSLIAILFFAAGVAGLLVLTH